MPGLSQGRADLRGTPALGMSEEHSQPDFGGPDSESVIWNPEGRLHASWSYVGSIPSLRTQADRS